jgi:hypothetical protein
LSLASHKDADTYPPPIGTRFITLKDLLRRHRKPGDFHPPYNVMFPPPLLTGTLNVFDSASPAPPWQWGWYASKHPGVRYNRRVVSPSPRWNVPCSPRVVHRNPFPLSRLVVRPLPCSLYAPVRRRFGPYLAFHRRRIRRSSGPVYHAVTCCGVTGASPSDAATMGHGGPLVPVICVKIAVLSGPLVAAYVSPP